MLDIPQFSLCHHGYNKALCRSECHEKHQHGGHWAHDLAVQALRAAGMAAAGTADFVVGPELPAVSSTQAREALGRGDREATLQLLHPAVADWLLARQGRRKGRKRPAETHPPPAPSKQRRADTRPAATAAASAVANAVDAGDALVTSAFDPPATVASNHLQMMSRKFAVNFAPE